MPRCLRCLVSGRVQGVFFRASATSAAARLGLDARARNLPDGRVEVVLRGSEAALTDMLDWLSRGPPQARVDDVSQEEISAAEFEGFRPDY